MKVHGTISEWDEHEFNTMFNRFENDEIDEAEQKRDAKERIAAIAEAKKNNTVYEEEIHDDDDGFSKQEFRRMIRYIVDI